MSLDEFGAEAPDALRKVAEDEHGRPACPVSRNPVDHTEGEIEVGVRNLADASLVGALESAGVSSVRSYGWTSPHADVVMPQPVSSREAAEFSAEFVGIEAEFSAETLFIPVRRDDLVPAEPLPGEGPADDGLQEDSADDVQEDATPYPDAGGSDDRERERTRVGHVQDDDVDVYIGRHGDDGQKDLVTTEEPGEPGWLGNPYPVEVFGREDSISMFMDALLTVLEEDPAFRRELVERCRGKVLGCWCRSLDEDEPACHGDVIADVVDRVLVRREDVEDDEDGDEVAVPDGGVQADEGDASPQEAALPVLQEVAQELDARRQEAKDDMSAAEGDSKEETFHAGRNCGFDAALSVLERKSGWPGYLLLDDGRRSA